MNGKRVVLLIFTILWYILTITLIVKFVLGLLNGDASFEFFITYFILSMILAFWQIIVVKLCGKMYNFSAYLHRGTGRLNILGIILFVICAPITLLWHIVYTFKPLWLLIRYNPEDF